MKIKVPHTLVLLFGMMVLSLIMTYLLPQGEFQTVVNDAGKNVVVPDSYEKFPERSFLSFFMFFSFERMQCK